MVDSRWNQPIQKGVDEDRNLLVNGSGQIMSRQITTQNTTHPQGQKASIRLRSNESNKPRSTAAVFGPVQGTTTGGLSSSQMEQPVLKQVKLKQ